MAAAVAVVNLAGPLIVWRSGVRLSMDGTTVALAVAVLVPGVVGGELFTRGTLYSLLERWGTVAAVLGAAVPAAIGTVLGGGGLSVTIPTLVTGVIVGYSRAATGSVLPALIGPASSLIVAAVLLSG